MVTTEGIEMDKEKTDAVQCWEAPASVKEVQAFLGFANFYRQFIPDFSKLSQPLVGATKGTHFVTKSGKKKVKYEPFEWNGERQKAFEDLKHAFTTSPVLAHYDPELETWMETDASDFVIAGVLSQMHGSVLKPVAYFSKKMTPAECNYMIYDKELLAIVKGFEAWRPELASVRQPIKVFTDHKNLEHFMTMKQLNRRQARWAEFLSEFDFCISYRPGKEGEKPDVLTKRSQDLPQGVDDSRQQQQFQKLFTENQVDSEVKKALEIAFSANTAATSADDNGINAIDDEINAVDGIDADEDIVDVRGYVEGDRGLQLSKDPV